MIPYVEIKDKYNYKTIALVEPQECWFELSYYDVGEFEVYCRATRANLIALQKGQFVKLPSKRFIWVITSVRYTFNSSGTRMILAHGYEAKWLLSKRCILTPKELQGNITTAVYGLVNHAMGTGANAAREVLGFKVGTNNLLIDISGTQAPRGNLLEFTNTLLKSYQLGSMVIYENGALIYKVFNGEVKTRSVRFSQSLDNLLSSEYLTDDGNVATSALVVSTFDETYTEGETENKRKVEYIKDVDKGKTGIDRAEVFIESNISTKYEDASGEEQETTPTSALYQSWLEQEGKNKLAEHTTIEEINGEIDLLNSNYKFDYDFFIGDMVRVQDEFFNFYEDVRILKYTIKQDANGYGEEAEYGE